MRSQHLQLLLILVGVDWGGLGGHDSTVGVLGGLDDVDLVVVEGLLFGLLLLLDHGGGDGG